MSRRAPARPVRRTLAWGRAAGAGVRAVRRHLARAATAVVSGLRAALDSLRAVWAAAAARIPIWRARAFAAALGLARLGRAGLLLGTAAGILAVGLGTTAFATSRIYADFGGAQRDVDALVWADRPAGYAGATCLSCHVDELTAQAASHATVDCEGCHGPLADHPVTDFGTASRLVLPESDACLTCHAAAPGHPAGFPTVEPADHYNAADCLRCHDPHDVVAAAPPDVTHPLVRLPACTTCHAPDGLKRVPSGHEPVVDSICLDCHAVPTDAD